MTSGAVPERHRELVPHRRPDWQRPFRDERAKPFHDGHAATRGGTGRAAGALLLGDVDRTLGLTERVAACFQDGRHPELIEHSVRTLVMQRIVALALGYEDLNDHDQLRHDPVLATLAGKLAARRKGCEPLAGKSTLNRLEHAPETKGGSRYHKISHDPAAFEALFVDCFIEAHETVPEQIILDLDATDDPLHGQQEGRFFHGYYGGYCYLPLYIFCGRHLLVAKLRPANTDASAGSLEELERLVSQIRGHWPEVRIVLRADSGFACDALMSWCEAQHIDFIFGLAKNTRLKAQITDQMAQAQAEHARTGQPARRFRDFRYRTLKSWSAERRVVGKAEQLPGKANPRFVVTSFDAGRWPARALYEQLYCARGEMENRIKECQLHLFADRTRTSARRWQASRAASRIGFQQIRFTAKASSSSSTKRRCGCGNLRQAATFVRLNQRTPLLGAAALTPRLQTLIPFLAHRIPLLVESMRERLRRHYTPRKNVALWVLTLQRASCATKSMSVTVLPSRFSLTPSRQCQWGAGNCACSSATCACVLRAGRDQPDVAVELA